MAKPLKSLKTPEIMQPIMIARCGINCSLCQAHLREKKHCAGCNGADENKAHYCVVCGIKNCPETQNSKLQFCFECGSFPCARLRHLDKRYRTRYGLSAIANLKQIRDAGIAAFLASEQAHWKCPQCGGVVCMHRAECVFCGASRIIQPFVG